VNNKYINVAFQSQVKTGISISLLIYYVFGTFCLPQGNFSVVAELPHMYKHCKATEDKHMNVFDFVTDHLINVDGLFDKHDHGDEQKSHSPLQFHQAQCPITFLSSQQALALNRPILYQYQFSSYRDAHYVSHDLSSVFRPPIV